MIEALKNPDAYSWITSKCGSQAAIASVERKSVGIHAMTLNTFKKYSDTALDGGFEQLEKIRVAIKKKSKIQETKSRMKLKVGPYFIKKNSTKPKGFERSSSEHTPT